MSDLAGQPLAGAAAILMALFWGCAASLVPLVRYRWRGRVFWTIALTGVPVLGWLTYVWGPMIGLVGLALGMLTLMHSPLLFIRRRPAREAIQPPAASPVE